MNKNFKLDDEEKKILESIDDEEQKKFIIESWREHKKWKKSLEGIHYAMNGKIE